MRWKITIEGLDEFSGRDTAEMVIEKPFSRLSEGEIGLSISDGESIMALLQQLVVKQQCDAYVLTSRYCTDCQTFRRIKDYGKRKIRTVYGRVEVSNPRIMHCRRCLPYFCDASAVLRDICPDRATQLENDRGASNYDAMLTLLRMRDTTAARLGPPIRTTGSPEIQRCAQPLRVQKLNSFSSSCAIEVPSSALAMRSRYSQSKMASDTHVSQPSEPLVLCRSGLHWRERSQGARRRALRCQTRRSEERLRFVAQRSSDHSLGQLDAGGSSKTTSVMPRLS